MANSKFEVLLATYHRWPSSTWVASQRLRHECVCLETVTAPTDHLPFYQWELSPKRAFSDVDGCDGKLPFADRKGEKL